MSLYIHIIDGSDGLFFKYMNEWHHYIFIEKKKVEIYLPKFSHSKEYWVIKD